MSSGEQKNDSPSQKSPGKGGKSLQLMQQRLQGTPEGGAGGTEQPQQAGAAPAGTPAAAAPSSGPPAPSPSPSPPGGRPKGKDFAAMSARAPRPESAGAPAPSPPQQQQVASGGPPGGKPKGKDFSAMASRMPQPADPARAAQMQADARAAAGMPPLEHPTATGVTIPPPAIPAPRQAPPPQQQQRPPPMAPAGGQYYPGQSGGPVPMAPRASSSSMPAPAPPKPSPQQPPRQRKSLPPSKKSTTPTPIPKASEGRLSSPWQASTSSKGHAVAAAAPHMAPLVGPRLQDLLQQIDPSYTLDAAAEHQVLQLVDDFLDKLCKQSLRVAQHRGSKTLDVQDVQLILAKQWNIVVPGLGPPVLTQPTAATAKAPAARSGSMTTAASKGAATTAAAGKRKSVDMGSSGGPTVKKAKSAGAGSK